MLRILEEQPAVQGLVENTLDAEFDFDGTDEELAGILKRLVLADVPVLAFREKEGNLEEVFMRVTGGESV